MSRLNQNNHSSLAPAACIFSRDWSLFNTYHVLKLSVQVASCINGTLSFEIKFKIKLSPTASG